MGHAGRGLDFRGVDRVMSFRCNAYLRSRRVVAARALFRLSCRPWFGARGWFCYEKLDYFHIVPESRYFFGARMRIAGIDIARVGLHAFIGARRVFRYGTIPLMVVVVAVPVCV